MNAPQVILASKSPRRQEFFHALGIPFLAQSADIDETPKPHETAAELVDRLAQAKAWAVGSRLASNREAIAPHLSDDVLVIGADTVVTIESEVLGKPADGEEARAMLTRLRGRPHLVHTATAVALFAKGNLKRKRSLINTTTVNMRAYSDDEIITYVATGDPLDKAGAYAIQHQQFRPAQCLTGCPAGVMGLPAADLLHLLKEFNVNAARSPLQICPPLTGLQCCQK